MRFFVPVTLQVSNNETAEHSRLPWEILSKVWLFDSKARPLKTDEDTLKVLKGIRFIEVLKASCSEIALIESKVTFK